MTNNAAREVVLHADPEHSWLRLAVIGVLLVAFAVSFFSLYWLLPNIGGSIFGDYALFLSCLGGLMLALAISALAEFAFKRRWHSGNRLILDESGITAEKQGEESDIMAWHRRISVTKWYFPLRGFPRGGRERRVPSSWFCFACQLRQDDKQMIVHSYLSPGKGEPLLDSGMYHKIRPGDYHEGSSLRKLVSAPSRPTIPKSVLAGDDGIYWLAERRRWNDGLELTPADFQTFIRFVDNHLTE